MPRVHSFRALTLSTCAVRRSAAVSTLECIQFMFNYCSEQRGALSCQVILFRCVLVSNVRHCYMQAARSFEATLVTSIAACLYVKLLGTLTHSSKTPWECGDVFRGDPIGTLWSLSFVEPRVFGWPLCASRHDRDDGTYCVYQAACTEHLPHLPAYSGWTSTASPLSTGIVSPGGTTVRSSISVFDDMDTMYSGDCIVFSFVSLLWIHSILLDVGFVNLEEPLVRADWLPVDFGRGVCWACERLCSCVPHICS